MEFGADVVEAVKGYEYVSLDVYDTLLVRPYVRPKDVFRHIDAVCEMGGEHILGFGSDFDGIESWPEGLSHPGEFINLINTMRAHGYSGETIENIAGKNFWRLLKSAE